MDCLGLEQFKYPPNNNFGNQPWETPFMKGIKRRRAAKQTSASQNKTATATCSWPHPNNKCKCNGTDIEIVDTFSPAIYKATGIGKEWSDNFIKGFEASVKTLKPVGPTAVFMADKNSDPASIKQVGKALCWDLEGTNATGDCKDVIDDFVQQAKSGQPSAGTSPRNYADVGDNCKHGGEDGILYAELVTITVVNQAGPDGKDPLNAAFVGLHEYTHSFQMHYLPGPKFVFTTGLKVFPKGFPKRQ